MKTGRLAFFVALITCAGVAEGTPEEQEILRLMEGTIYTVAHRETVDGVLGQSGKLRALAVTTAKRSAVLPEVPTVAELALPGFEVTGWFGILAPAATPPAVVERLNREVNGALAQPAVQQRLQALGVEPGGGTPAAFGQLIAAETTRYGEAIRRLGLRAE